MCLGKVYHLTPRVPAADFAAMAKRFFLFCAVALCVALVPPAIAEEAAAPSAPLDAQLLAQTMATAATLPRLRALIVARDGVPVVERVFRGPSLNTPVNIKSASKTIITALVGAAIERGLIKDTAQPILPLLANRVPAGLDPRTQTITVEHLLTMRSGLERTSGGRNYGPWVTSPNWVRYAISRPFVDAPGGNMLYSTGNTHLLSAILTNVTGKSTLEIAREWLGAPLGIQIPPWTRDPQGLYFGGNEMALSPRALLRFGELYRNRGISDGKRILPEAWIDASWTPSGYDPGRQRYGYGWFITQAQGHGIYYAWGYGGQMLYIVPSLDLTIVATSDSTTTSMEDGYRCQLHALISEGFVPAAMRATPDQAAVPLLDRSWSFPALGGNRCVGDWMEDSPADGI